jgi:succinate dehydrogenase hydrophobic anchor subunit
MSEIQLLKKSLKDYLTPELLKFLIYPLIGSIIVLYFAFFSAASFGLDALENAQLEVQQHQTKIENGIIDESTTVESYTGSSILDFLLKHTITSWIVSFLVYTVGIFAIGYMSIFISLLIIGMLTPKILSIIHKKHYPHIDITNGYGNILNAIFKLINSAIVMIILFIFLIPFYFIPVINIFIINIPFFYFFHKMLHFDVSSTLLEKEKFSELYYKNKTAMRGRSLFLYSLSLIPFTAFFISVFYIVYLGHAYFQKIDKIERSKDNFDVKKIDY